MNCSVLVSQKLENDLTDLFFLVRFSSVALRPTLRCCARGVNKYIKISKFKFNNSDVLKHIGKY